MSWTVFSVALRYKTDPAALKGWRERERGRERERERGKKDGGSGQLMSKCVITVLDLDN